MCWFNRETLKTDFYNHKISMETARYKNSTTLSKYIFKIKEKYKNLIIKKGIMKKYKLCNKS